MDLGSELDGASHNQKGLYYRSRCHSGERLLIARVGRRSPTCCSSTDPWSSGGSILMVDPRTVGPGIRTSIGRLDITGLYSRSWSHRCGNVLPYILEENRLLATSTDPWSIHKLAGDETCRMDLGSVTSIKRQAWNSAWQLVWDIIRYLITKEKEWVHEAI